MRLIHANKARWLDAFPDAEEALPSGLLAIGGDLSPNTLLAAYARGIFPWYSAGEPILWWNLSPRCVLFPNSFLISKRSRRKIKNSGFTLTYDRDFASVLFSCASCTAERPATWITPEMAHAYMELHKLGYGHSVEVWKNGTLVGGLYGVALGRIFFGESMFRRACEASRAALVGLIAKLHARQFLLLDCQQASPHMLAMGATEITRKEFSDYLSKGVDVAPSSWQEEPLALASLCHMLPT